MKTIRKVLWTVIDYTYAYELRVIWFRKYLKNKL